MAMCYKKLWKLLIDRDMTRADLRDKTGLSPATLAKMSKGEASARMSLSASAKPCNATSAMSWTMCRRRIVSKVTMMVTT